MKTLLTGLALTLAIATPSAAQELKAETITEAAAIRDKALTSDLAWNVLESLTTEVGPRLAGTKADIAAVNWGMAKFKELGFDKVWKEPVTIPVWRRTHESGAIVAPYPQPVVLTAVGKSVSTPKDGLTAEVMHFKNFAEMAAAPDGVAKGKIIYISERMERHRTGRGYGKTGVSRFAGPVMAAKKGASGLIIRSIGTDDQRSPHTGGTNYVEDVVKIPVGALSNPDADQMDRIIARGKTVTFTLNLQTETLPDAITYNVIGEITGSEAPDEIIAIGGHLDSWDLGTGAIDDASGIAITVAAAKLVAEGKRPRRTIRVVMFGAEEIGLFGANQYLVDHKDNLKNHIIGAESDFGAGRVWALSSNVGRQSLHVVDAMLALMAPLDVVRSSNVASGSADFGPMVRAGMPAMGLDQDGTMYFDLHHTPNDTLNKVDPEELAQNVAAWTVFIKLAADWEGRFDR